MKTLFKYKSKLLTAPKRTPCDRGISVLAVTSEAPWPLNTGGHLRTFHLLRALARRFQVRLVCPTPEPGETIEALGAHAIEVCPARVGRRATWREALRAAAALARDEPYVFYHRHNRPGMGRAIEAELRRNPPDVVYLDHLDSCVFWSASWRVPALVDLHNAYAVLARRAALERRGLLRLYLAREARLLERMECRATRVVDTVLTVSEQERSYFAGLGANKVRIVPNGVDCRTYEALPLGRRGGKPLVLYVGAMSWAPNAAAAIFLATEVLPKIRARLPAARLRIVGRSPTVEIRALAKLPGVEVFGDAPEILPHLREAHVLAVPLRVGGGTRLKILEAFAAGLPVVSTAIGAEGLEISPRRHLVVAPPEEFATEILNLLNDDELGRRLAGPARELVRRRYDWEVIGEFACDAIADAVRSRGPR